MAAIVLLRVGLRGWMRLSGAHFWLYDFSELLKIEMKHSHGFTLIELVMVIVVLGILSVVAAPKFISLRKDSLISTLYGMRSAIDTAGQETYSMAVVRGLETSASASITSHGQIIPLVYGYPAGGVSTGLSSLIEFPTGDWKQRASVYDGAWVYWHGTLQEDAGTAQCYLRYRQPTAAGRRPVIDIETSGCK